jgi:endo-1,4-beta-xylanase
MDLRLLATRPRGYGILPFWFRNDQTIGPEYVAESFRVAHAADPRACFVLNEFGFETDHEWDTAADKRSAALRVIDALLAQHVPVHALGVQAHLRAGDFAAGKFDARGSRRTTRVKTAPPAARCRTTTS